MSESRTNKLAVLYKKAGTLNEDYPHELIKKLSIYGQILELVGGMHADAVREWKLAESRRREVIASAMIYHAELEGAEIKTAADRAAAAEVAGAQARREEAIAEGTAQKWRNAKDAIENQINIMKKVYEHHLSVAKGGV